MSEHAAMRRLAVKSSPEALTLVRTWRSKYTLWPVLLTLSALMIGAGAFAYGPMAEADLVGIVGRIVLTGLTLLGAYWALTSLLNRSVVTVAGGCVSVSHGPLPVWGLSALAREPLREVKVRFQRQNRTDGPTYYIYELVAHLRDGREVMLFSDRDRALTEQAHEEIANYLAAAGGPRS